MDLGLKKSMILRGTRICVLMLAMVGFLFMFLGLYDPRTEEQKIADAKAEFLAETKTKVAIQAVKKVRHRVYELKCVEVLPDNSYALVVYIDAFGEQISVAYDFMEKEVCDERIYRFKSSGLMAQNFYFNKEVNVIRRFTDPTELEIIWNEVINSAAD